MSTGLFANGSGVLNGKFTIPAGVRAGSKEVSFIGVGGSMGVAVFSGQGTVERQTWQQQTIVNETRWQSPPPPPPPVVVRRIDPVAQTFMLPATTQVTGVDVWFVTAPTSLTLVQLRETTAGFPNQVVIAEARVEPEDIVVGGAHTRIVFEAPTLLLSGNEYALVVLCNDAVGGVSVAELGKYDPVALRWITSQPYTVGVMLSSSNASSWTVHQDRDMAFRILKPSFSQTTRTINLGTVAVVDATDLLLMSYGDRPASNTGIEYALTLPDTSVITVSDGQPVQLAAAITGNVQISAILSGSSTFSPVLHPGTQLVSGEMAATADYVTRAIPAGASSDIKVIFEAVIPSGANVQAYFKGVDALDDWALLPVTATQNMDDGFVEFICSDEDITETAIKIKLVLSGTPAARPRVRDLRVIIV